MLVEDENLKPVSDISAPEGDEVLAGLLANPALAGARIVDDSDRTDVIRNRMHELGEAFFKNFGPDCVQRGWSVYPQTRDGGRRPALVDGQSVKPSLYRERLPTQAEICYWSLKAATQNVALQLGSASGHTFALDIDVDAEVDQQWIAGLAFHHLGVTPLRRTGRRPAFIYRRDPSSPLRSASYRLEVGGGMIEVLGDGKTLTIYGAHHGTGDYFRWPGADQPALIGPEAAPLVTAEQIKNFLDAVDHWKTLAGYRAKPVTHFTAKAIEFDGKVNLPPKRMDIGVWEKDGLGKILVDGRQGWLFARAGYYVRLNADAVRSDDGSKAVYAAFLTEALRSVARTGRWSSDAAIEAEARSVFNRTRDNLLADRIKAITVAIREDGTREIAPVGGVLAIPGDLGEAASWIGPVGSKARRKSPSRLVRKTDADHAPDPAKAKKFALLDTAARIEVGQRVAAKVRESIDSWLTLLWDNAARIGGLIDDGHSLPDALREVGALIAPTGAGKTSTLIRAFAEMRQARGPLPFALAVFLPGHSNAAEAKAIALSSGAQDAWDEAVEASRGLKVLQYKGKVLAGCLLGDRMAKLQAANIPTSGMCSQTSKDAFGEKVTTECQFKAICPAMFQIERAKIADLIIMPHAYLTSPMPKPVKDRVGAIVIDERFWPEVAKTAMLPLDALRLPRKRPFLTKTDKREGVTVEDLIMERDQAATIVTQALLAGQCPAATLAAYTKTTVLKKRTISGIDLVTSARTVCGRAQTSSLAVRPGMSDAEVTGLIEQPEADGVLVEWRFWKIMEERVLDILAGEVSPEKHERRIKLLKPSAEQATICISWRIEMNLSDRPAFLLDASADERILGKVFGRRPVNVIRVDAPLHLRCVVVAESFSDQSLLPDADANKSPEDKERAAIKLSKCRMLSTRVGGLYGTKRVLVGSTLPVEKAMKTAWASPPNVDFGHFGAFRGLDAYKHHSVAISFGRMELPIDVLDALVRSFNYDDEIEEADWNEDGTGWIGNQRLRAPQGERRLQRRDGAFVTIQDSVFPERYEWHRRVQGQWREEELRQFAGRLRPVYRTGEAPLWICAATCVPDGIVVDDVVTLDDLVRGDPLHEIARRTRGVIDEKAGTIHPDMLSPSLARIGLDLLSERSARDYAIVRIWVDGQEEGRLVRVAAWVPDMWQALEDAQRRLGHDLDRYEVVQAAPQVNVLAIVPKPSKLDRMMSRLPNAETATRDELLLERSDAEVALRERLIEALDGKPPKARLEIDLILAVSKPADEPPKPPPTAPAA